MNFVDALWRTLFSVCVFFVRALAFVLFYFHLMNSFTVIEIWFTVATTLSEWMMECRQKYSTLMKRATTWFANAQIIRWPPTLYGPVRSTNLQAVHFGWDWFSQRFFFAVIKWSETHLWPVNQLDSKDISVYITQATETDKTGYARPNEGCWLRLKCLSKNCTSNASYGCKHSRSGNVRFVKIHLTWITHCVQKFFNLKRQLVFFVFFVGLHSPQWSLRYWWNEAINVNNVFRSIEICNQREAIFCALCCPNSLCGILCHCSRDCDRRSQFQQPLMIRVFWIASAV